MDSSAFLDSLYFYFFNTDIYVPFSEIRIDRSEMLQPPRSCHHSFHFGNSYLFFQSHAGFLSSVELFLAVPSTSPLP